MTRANFVKSARKDYPEHEIQKGESYYWWKFRYGNKHFSKTPPKPSQLTNSTFYSTAYGIQEQIESLDIDPDDLSMVADDLRTAADEIRDLGEDQASNADNMPESLQYSETAELLRSRADACKSLADEMESAADDIDRLAPVEDEDEDEDKDEDEKAERLQLARDELTAQVSDILAGISWDFE